jgi:hypothetical protein
MIVIGLLLIALAALLSAGVLMKPGGSAEIEFFGLILPNLSARTLVLCGVVIGLLAALGLGLVRGQIARRRRRRRAADRQRARMAVTQDEDPFLLGR